MGEKHDFEGTVVRVERDGFGIVEFSTVFGGTTHGLFSTTISEPGFPFARVKTGMHVKGIAEFDDKELAAIKKIELAPTE